MSELPSIRGLRDLLSLSLADFGARVGISSKGQMSDIENGKAPCGLKTALAIEALARGANYSIDAAQLNEDVRRARESAMLDQTSGTAPSAELAA
jgi:transcriptional regulator with XRE-family HTH domain